MAKIKVYFVSFKSYPLFNKDITASFGGAEVQMYQLGKKLSEDDNFQVNFIVSDFGQSAVEYRENIKLLSNFFQNSRYKKKHYESFFRMIVRKWRKWWSKLVFVIRILWFKPDIVVFSILDPVFGKLRFWTRLIGVNLVYVVSSTTECSVDGQQKILNDKQIRLFQYGLKNSDLIIAVTSDQQKMLKDNFGLDSVKLSLLFDVDNIQDKNYDGFILWVGRCVVDKRPDYFVELARRFPREKFMMIALPTASQKKFFEKIKQDCAGISNLEFKEFIPFYKIDEYFKRAKLFVITSVFEGFGGVIVQAAKNKTPTISFVNPDNIFSDYDLGYFVKTVDEMCGVASFLIKKPELLTEKGDSAFAYAVNHHNADNLSFIFKNYLKMVYEKKNKSLFYFKI